MIKLASIMLCGLPTQFTSVELYQAYADYEDMMQLSEALIRDCAMQACGTLQV